MSTASTNPQQRPFNTIVRIGERVVVTGGKYAERVGVVRQRGPAGCYVELPGIPAYRSPFILLRDLIGERDLERLQAEARRDPRPRYAAEEEE